MLVNFLLWVKWVLTNAKTVLFFCHHFEICKQNQRVGRTQGERQGETEHPLGSGSRVTGPGRESIIHMLPLTIPLHLVWTETKGWICWEGQKLGEPWFPQAYAIHGVRSSNVGPGQTPAARSFFFLKPPAVCSSREVVSEFWMKPESEALSQHVCRILAGPRLSYSTFHLLLPSLIVSWQPS